MSITAYAVFDDATLAVRAIGALLDHGISRDDVSLLANENYPKSNATDELSGRRGGESTGATTAARTSREREWVAKQGITTTTGADAAAGAEVGAAVGLGVGALAGIASLVVPGVGLVVGSGALAAAIGAAAATTAAGAATGGVVGYLRDMGVPEPASASYHDAIVQGGTLVAVGVPGGAEKTDMVLDILAKYGALTVSAV